MLVSTPIWEQGKEVQQEVMNDPILQDIIADLQKNPDLRPGFSIQNGVLLYKDRLGMSSYSAFIPLLLAEFHSSPLGENSGFLRTYRHNPF